MKIGIVSEALYQEVKNAGGGNISAFFDDHFQLDRVNFYKYIKTREMPMGYLDALCEVLNLSVFCFIDDFEQKYHYSSREPYKKEDDEDFKRFRIFSKLSKEYGLNKKLGGIDFILYLYCGFSEDDIKRIPEKDLVQFQLQIYKQADILEKKYLID